MYFVWSIQTGIFLIVVSNVSKINIFMSLLKLIIRNDSKEAEAFLD